MTLIVTGSITIDSVDTPTDSVRDILGGSSVFFSAAASFFGPVRLVGAVGGDCPDDEPVRCEDASGGYHCVADGVPCDDGSGHDDCGDDAVKY